MGVAEAFLSLLNFKRDKRSRFDFNKNFKESHQHLIKFIKCLKLLLHNQLAKIQNYFYSFQTEKTAVCLINVPSWNFQTIRKLQRGSRTDQEISLNIHQVLLEAAVTSAFARMGRASNHRPLFVCAVPVYASKHFLASPVGYLYERGDR